MNAPTPNQPSRDGQRTRSDLWSAAHTPASGDQPRPGGSQLVLGIESALTRLTLQPEHTQVAGDAPKGADGNGTRASGDNGASMDAVTEIPWGTDNLYRRWFSDDPPPPDALTNALGAIDDYLVDLDRDRSPTIVAVAARGPAAVAIARLEQGTRSPGLPAAVPRKDLEEVFRLVANESLHERSENPGLEATEDATTIVAGLCIVLAAARRYRCAHVTLMP